MRIAHVLHAAHAGAFIRRNLGPRSKMDFGFVIAKPVSGDACLVCGRVCQASCVGTLQENMEEWHHAKPLNFLQQSMSERERAKQGV